MAEHPQSWQQKAFSKLISAGGHTLVPAVSLDYRSLISPTVPAHWVVYPPTHLNQVRNHHREHEEKKNGEQEGLLSVRGHHNWTGNMHLSSQHSVSKLPPPCGVSPRQCVWAEVPTHTHAHFIFSDSPVLRGNIVLVLWTNRNSMKKEKASFYGK